MTADDVDDQVSWRATQLTSRSRSVLLKRNPSTTSRWWGRNVALVAFMSRMPNARRLRSIVPLCAHGGFSYTAHAPPSPKQDIIIQVVSIPIKRASVRLAGLQASVPFRREEHIATAPDLCERLRRATLRAGPCGHGVVAELRRGHDLVDGVRGGHAVEDEGGEAVATDYVCHEIADVPVGARRRQCPRVVGRRARCRWNSAFAAQVRPVDPCSASPVVCSLPDGGSG